MDCRVTENFILTPLLLASVTSTNQVCKRERSHQCITIGCEITGCQRKQKLFKMFNSDLFIHSDNYQVDLFFKLAKLSNV